MKRKSLIIISIVLLIINFIFTGKAFAASICTVGFSVSNSTPQRDGEVVVTVSVKNITEAIASVGFTAKYDSEKFDAPVVETLNGWTQQVAGTTYVLIAPANEGTTKAEDIYKLKFKVKSNASIGDTKISFSNLQVAKDDGSVVDIDGVENTITIKEQKQDEQKQDEQKQDEQKQDEQKQDEQKQDENKNSQDTKDTTNSSSKKDTNTQNIKTINGKEDNTKSSKTLPKTGKTQLIITGIAILVLVAAISYKVYRKYNGI